MRYFSIGMLILCLLVGLCWYAEREIQAKTREISVPLELALAAVQEGDEAEAQAWVSRAKAAWEQNEPVLDSFISHSHTNEIGEAMEQLRWSRGSELGQAVEGVLKQVQDLVEMERIKWKNILSNEIPCRRAACVAI